MPRSRMLKDRVFTLLVFTLAIVGIAPLFAILSAIIINGFKTIISIGPSFLYGLPSSPLSSSPGGIGPALVGSLVIMFLSMMIGYPLAFMAAVLAVEYPKSIIGRAVDVLAKSLMEVPSILIGILVYAIIVVPMGGFSAWAGSIAVSLVILPYIYTHIETALRNIPSELKLASYSLGLSRAKTVFVVFTSKARRGLLTAALIGLARASGETAPLLFTIGGNWFTYFQGLGKPIGAIPLLIYTYTLTPYPNYHEAAWGASLVLLTVYLCLFTLFRRLSG
ncbi:MAG: phosphate ABC transporter permease PstA [Crenarchaeota archaeon]|nr:phosphate ABC transporter permease PstA [Thermoproteota archaeon]